jgi:3'(2'), 5'-bisphosphate nucleotidase
MLATGDADIYPRFGPTSEWDIAAAHAILLAAGGDILDISSMKTLEYGKKDTILNPYFVAFGASVDITEVGKIFNEFS